MVAEFESDLIRLRTVEGMKVAKAKGRLRGKQPKLNRKQEAHLVSLVHSGEYSTLEVAELFGVGRSTVYRAIERQPGCCQGWHPWRVIKALTCPWRQTSRIRHLAGTLAPQVPGFASHVDRGSASGTSGHAGVSAVASPSAGDARSSASVET